MKMAVLTLASAVLSLAQDTAGLKHLTMAPLSGGRPIRMTAASIERGAAYPSVIRLKGKVEIQTEFCHPARQDGQVVCAGSMLLRADEATVHEQTGEIEAHGNVSATPIHLK